MAGWLKAGIGWLGAYSMAAAGLLLLGQRRQVGSLDPRTGESGGGGDDNDNNNNNVRSPSRRVDVAV